MTVRVAAICNGGSAIVTASDSMMSWGASVTAETSLKYDVIHKRWAVMVAGDDITPTEPMIRLFRAALADIELPSVTRVEEAVRASWRAVKNQIAETHILSPFGISMETFVKKGRGLFGDVKFSDMCALINQAAELPCELLVHGFDHNDHGYVVHVLHPG